MPAISQLNHTWGHTLTDILNYDPKTQMGITEFQPQRALSNPNPNG